MGSVSQSTRGVFFWLLLLFVVVDVHTAVCSSNCYVTVFGPCSRAHDRCHNRPQCVFLPPPRVCRSKLRLSYMCHRERGVRGVSSVVCYAVLCPWSGGLCGFLCRVMPWSGGRVLFPAISRLIRVQVRSSRVQFGTKNDAAGYTLAEPRHIRVKCGAGQSAACV